jgi:hypothetical protein
MRRSATRGRPRHLTDPLRFQVLRVGFTISADDPALERRLRCLAQHATQPETARATVSYSVRRSNGAYQILRNGVVQDVQFDHWRVLDAVYRGVQADALAAWPQAAVVRAITGSWEGERFMVVGEPLRDRSSLALHLLSRGAQVEADDLAILDDGALTAYPRPWRVFGRDAPLPPGSPTRDELPYIETSTRGPWTLDLSAAGIDWRISTGPVERIVLLEANYGGQTRLHPVPRYEAVRVVMSCCDARDNVPDTIRSIARLADGAHCCRLRLGALELIGDFWPPDWGDTMPGRNEKGSGHGRDP